MASVSFYFITVELCSKIFKSLQGIQCCDFFHSTQTGNQTSFFGNLSRVFMHNTRKKRSFFLHVTKEAPEVLLTRKRALSAVLVMLCIKFIKLQILHCVRLRQRYPCYLRNGDLAQNNVEKQRFLPQIVCSSQSLHVVF